MHTELPSAGPFALPIVSPLIASIHPNDPIPFCYPPSLAITPFLCSLHRSMISSSDASNSMSFTKNCVSVFWWMRNSRKFCSGSGVLVFFIPLRCIWWCVVGVVRVWLRLACSHHFQDIALGGRLVFPPNSSFFCFVVWFCRLAILLVLGLLCCLWTLHKNMSIIPFQE